MTAPRVLVLGGRPVISLAACRALGRAGHVVGVTGVDRVEEAGVSRHTARYHRVPSIHAGAAAWADAVRDAVRAGRYDVVLVTADPEVACLIDLDLPVPTCPRVSGEHVRLIDKGLLADLCADAGVGYPRTERPASRLEDRTLATRIGAPAVVKAARSAVLVGDRVLAMTGALPAGDARAAEQALAAVRQRGLSPVLQERVEGEKLHAVIVRRAGRNAFRLAFRVVREFPPDGGSETMLETMAHDHGMGGEILSILERLADWVGYDGILDAELLRDPGDGRIRLIDVNPRLWGSLSFAELLGLRATETALRDTLGMPTLRLPDVPAGRRYHHLVREARWLLRRRRPSRGYRATFARGDLWETPSLRDPAPHLVRVVRRVATAARAGRQRPS